MHELYAFLGGPMAWIAFGVFVFGSLYRLIRLLVDVHRKEPFIFGYMSLRYGLRSILRWSTPFATVNMRRQPAVTVVAFAFHLCLLALPVFLLAHIVLIEESWGVSWPALPGGLADAMALIVLAGCAFFWIRRLKVPEVRYVTSASDYVLLGLVAAPFLTGFLAGQQWFAYRFFSILHLLTGEMLLMAIPFTRLSHMLLAPFTRAYMGSEFGKVRCARDW